MISLSTITFHNVIIDKIADMLKLHILFLKKKPPYWNCWVSLRE